MSNGLNNRAADTGFANRGIGSHLALVWQSWELTGDPKYRNACCSCSVARAGSWNPRAGVHEGARPGIGQEGLVYGHWATATRTARSC